ncbi:MAG: hypothetical protein JKY17_08885 [Magnetovibrio sp.]|nr:hypothetical protein [Magnetovibrio sp.]
MSTVQPPPPPATPPTVNGQTSATAVVIKAPATLQSMEKGQVLQATVTATPVPKQVQVQTPLGSLTLQTAMTIPKGAVLTMVLSTLSPLTFQIGMVNGKPVPGALTTAQAKSGGLAPQSALTQAAQPLPVGTKLGAVLLRPAQAAPAFIIVPPPAQAKGQAAPALKTSKTAPGTPAQSAQATPNVDSKTTPSPAISSTTGTESLVKSSQPSHQGTLPSGTRFTVTVVRVESPTTLPASLLPTTAKGIAQGQTVVGTVIGRTPQGQPIVQAPNATISLDTRALLTDGAKITLRFDSTPTLVEPSSAAQRLGRAGLGLGLINAKSWDDLSDALKTLASIDPTRFQSVIQTALPQPGPKLNNQILFFLSALKGGDLKSLFGETAKTLLTKERPGLMSRLGRDFQAMSTLANDPQSGDWRLALIPMWSGERLEQVRFYHRGGGGGPDDENGDDDDTRFILDIDLSNLGHMQIDGLMTTSKGRLDLIVRTEKPLPDTMRQDIADITQTAQDVLGLTAAVSFQARPEDFVEFPPNTRPEQGLMA